MEKGAGLLAMAVVALLAAGIGFIGHTHSKRLKEKIHVGTTPMKRNLIALYRNISLIYMVGGILILLLSAIGYLVIG